jgi:hypothetical protein
MALPHQHSPPPDTIQPLTHSHASVGRRRIISGGGCGGQLADCHDPQHPSCFRNPAELPIVLVSLPQAGGELEGEEDGKLYHRRTEEQRAAKRAERRHRRAVLRARLDHDKGNRDARAEREPGERVEAAARAPVAVAASCDFRTSIIDPVTGWVGVTDRELVFAGRHGKRVDRWPLDEAAQSVALSSELVIQLRGGEELRFESIQPAERAVDLALTIADYHAGR